MSYLSPLTFVASALLLLTGCAGSNYAIAESDHDEPITAQFHVIGSTDKTPKVIGFIKPYDSSGKLGVCQAYLIDGSDDEFKNVRRRMVDENSYVALASPDEEDIRFAVIGAPLYRTTLGPAKRINVSRMKARCGTTSLPWADGLQQREVRLELYRTVYTYSTSSVPIYVPRIQWRR